jgi:hypothetical protein
MSIYCLTASHFSNLQFVVPLLFLQVSAMFNMYYFVFSSSFTRRYLHILQTGPTKTKQRVLCHLTSIFLKTTGQVKYICKGDTYTECLS